LYLFLYFSREVMIVGRVDLFKPTAAYILFVELSQFTGHFQT